MPEALTYSDARKNLASLMDRVTDSHDPIIITRRQAKPVVLMSLEEYNAIAETAYLLRSPKNAARLRESICEAKTEGGTSHELIEE